MSVDDQGEFLRWIPPDLVFVEPSISTQQGVAKEPTVPSLKQSPSSGHSPGSIVEMKRALRLAANHQSRATKMLTEPSRRPTAIARPSER